MFVKVVQPSSWDTIDNMEVNFVYDNQPLKKIASTIFGVDYSALKPDKDHVGIHLVALGDFEHYGLNRNFDGFTKESCQKHVNTFITNGHVFEHHRNDDPAKKLGDIKMAAYNEPMGRVELFIHAHKEKARDHLHKYETEKTAAFSMACKVLYDVCTKCGEKRTGRYDDNVCDHLKYQFGKEAEDGTIIGTLNPEPTWFDISFVTRPADRIAWDLQKVASAVDKDEAFRKWTYSLQSGLTLPSYMAIDSDMVHQKFACLKELAIAQHQALSTDSKTTKAFVNIVKSACSGAGVGDKAISELRKLPIPVAMRKLASEGVVLSPVEFFKYVYGDKHYKVRDKVALAIQRIPQAVREAVEDPVKICTQDTYNVISNVKVANVTSDLHHGSIHGDYFNYRVVLAKSSGYNQKYVDKTAEICLQCTPEIDKLAKEYVAYKVAALAGIVDRGFANNKQTYMAAAVQNLTI